jgi:hypothetical protein
VDEAVVASAEAALEAGGVADVRFDETEGARVAVRADVRLLPIALVERVEIVHHRDVVPVGHERVHEVAADEACAAGNEYVHLSPSRRMLKPSACHEVVEAAGVFRDGRVG